MGSLARILQRRTPNLCVLSDRQTVTDAVTTLTECKIGALLVVNDRGWLAGVFTERDLMTRVVARRRDPDKTLLGDVMTPDPVTASPEEDRNSAMRKMKAAGCRHLPVVVANGEVVDMLSMRDLLFVEIAEREAEVVQLRQYIAGSY